MTPPSSVVFGPSARLDRWWALLPSAAVLHARGVADLLGDVERAMTRDEPDRPFAFVLDLYGAREPGRQVRPPAHGSAAHRLIEQRHPGPRDPVEPNTIVPPA